MIEAKVLCDSIGEKAPRLFTAFARYPKFVHQESLRHRRLYILDWHDYDFSFSVSSARAIPFAKMLAEVRSDKLRAEPVYWGKEQKGMSPGESLTLDEVNEAARIWRDNALFSADQAEKMARLGVHKSIVNRLLEPYIHVNVIITGTEKGWLNFFGLRLDKAADKTLQALTISLFEIWNKSVPRLLTLGQWHLPLVDSDNVTIKGDPRDNDLIKTSVSNCARTSYISFETNRTSTLEENVRLYDKLLGSIPIHASPAEHQSTVDVCYTSNSGGSFLYANEGLRGNLEPGWIQFRKLLQCEEVAQRRD